MPKPVDGELNDEAVHLKQRGLYVENINYPLDLNHLPKNGHEYIHLVRQEHASIFPEESETVTYEPRTKISEITNAIGKIDLKEWKNREANVFTHIAIQLKLKRDLLMKKFPARELPDVADEKDCCLFCLGSEMYQKIYGDENVADVAASYPYLSIVLHLSQDDVLTLLKYMKEWSNVVKMTHIICRWIYALLACLRKPVSNKCGEFLEQLYDFCLLKIKDNDESEKNQLHFISIILKYYFCIKAYKLGTPLSRFQKLL